MVKFICLLCFTFLYFFCHKAEAVKLKEPMHKDCANWVKRGVKNITVTPSCGSKTCQLKRGTNVTVIVDFKSAVASKILTAKVYGEIAGVKVPFPLNNNNGCTSGINCPIKPEGDYRYNSTIEVKAVYPKISLLVEWELYGDNAEKVFCFVMPVEIV